MTYRDLTPDHAGLELENQYVSHRHHATADWTECALNALDLREEDLFGVTEDSTAPAPDLGWEGWVSPLTVDDELLSDEDLSVLRRGEQLRISVLC
jgi:hypothetical protein